MKNDMEVLSLVDVGASFEDLIEGGIETGKLIDIELNKGVALLTDLKEIEPGVFKFSGKVYMKE